MEKIELPSSCNDAGTTLCKGLALPTCQCCASSMFCITTSRFAFDMSGIRRVGADKCRQNWIADRNPSRCRFVSETYGEIICRDSGQFRKLHYGRKSPRMVVAIQTCKLDACCALTATLRILAGLTYMPVCFLADPFQCATIDGTAIITHSKQVTFTYHRCSCTKGDRISP
jgi:hypothetical protein